MIDSLVWFVTTVAVTILAIRALRLKRRRLEEANDGIDLDDDGIALSHTDAPPSGTPLDGDPMRWSDAQIEEFNIDRKAFDPAAYLAANPDVAVSGVDPWAHWVSTGRFQGRRLRTG
jgi:hypothetical protein